MCNLSSLFTPNRECRDCLRFRIDGRVYPRRVPPHCQAGADLDWPAAEEAYRPRALGPALHDTPPPAGVGVFDERALPLVQS